MSDQPTILITGATDGLGRALAHSLAAGGATLILHGRVDRLVQTIAAQKGMRSAVLDEVVRLVDAKLEANRRAADAALKEPRAQQRSA